jgi:Family of unknown function (DUF6112)
MVHALPSLIAVAAASLPASGPGGGPTSLDPTNTADVPGATLLSGLADGIGHYALFVAMLGIVIGAVMWAFGHFSHNYQQALNGRKGVLVSALAAILIGAAPFVINFFLGIGQKVSS